MAAAVKTVQYASAKTALPQLSIEQQGALYKAKQYAMQESVKHVLKKQQMQAGFPQGSTSVLSSQNQAMNLQRQQALVLMCRVYVGSIFYDLREEIVRQAFAVYGIIKSINMSFDPITGKHKGFAFIEYETPDAAQLAMEQMGGVLLGGRPIKIGRPSNMPQSHPIIDQILEESKTSKRVYVSSVHEDLSVDDLKSVFSAFGNIKSCALAPDPTSGKHKGYGSIEYETLQSAKDAISSMNLFDLGGQNLRVGRGIGPPPPTLQGDSLASNLMGVPSMLDMTAPLSMEPILPVTVNMAPMNVPKLTPPQPQLPILSPQLTVPPVAPPGVITVPVSKFVKPSRVVKLSNMVDPDEIDEDLEAEVTEECGKFGSVQKVVIYNEKQGEADSDPYVVKIFVKYEDSSAAENAVNTLNGRWFGGRQIESTFYPEGQFNHGVYNG